MTLNSFLRSLSRPDEQSNWGENDFGTSGSFGVPSGCRGMGKPTHGVFESKTLEKCAQMLTAPVTESDDIHGTA